MFDTAPFDATAAQLADAVEAGDALARRPQTLSNEVMKSGQSLDSA